MNFGFSGRGSGGPERNDSGYVAELRAYWEALREGEMLPRRDRVDPRGIANALEHSFLIERIAPGIARFRIAGMAYNDLMAMDIRGMPISALFTADARARLQTDLERVFRGPSVLTLDLEAERGLGRGRLGARMIMLPMLSQSDESTLAIGCIELTGDLGRAPRRLMIAQSKIEPIGQAVPVRPTPALAFAETQTAFLPPPRAVKGVPHLRLVKS
jgi:hypothetical protein